MNIEKEAVQRLFDMVCNSMDFGSGFLESEDVEVLRDVAVKLGVDPVVGTPYEFRRNYPHKFKDAWHTDLVCCVCDASRDDPRHV